MNGSAGANRELIRRRGALPFVSIASLLAFDNPIQALARMLLQFEQEFERGHALTFLVFGQLRLPDPEHPSEFRLGEIKTSNLPNAATDGLEV